MIGLLVGAMSLMPALIALRRRPETDLTTAADRLAGWVKNAEGAHWRQLLGGDRVPIDVRFDFCPTPGRSAVVPHAPAGSLQRVIDDFRATRPRRLVITGGPGAGKTVLATKLMLAIVEERTADEPVPVRMGLASWDPAVPLKTWLVSRLVQDFDRAPQVAKDLVERGRILPVLDGLDEMDAPATAVRDSRAKAALKALDAYQNGVDGAPFVLTCRTAQYDALAAAGHHVPDTAYIELFPVTAPQAHTYLTARRVYRPERWDPVLETLRSQPAGILARVLSTPWRLTLAATVYAESGDPSELLAHTSPAELEEYLLARYIPAVTGVHSGTGVPYTSAQVHDWLACMATYLEAGADSAPETRGAVGPASELVLHRLWRLAGQRRVRAVDVLLSLLIFLPGAALFYAQVPQVTTATGKNVTAVGICGVMLALAYRAGTRHTPPPSSARWPRRGTSARRRLVRRRWRVGAAAGLTVWALCACTLWLVPVIDPDLSFYGPFGLSLIGDGLVLGAFCGLPFGVVAGISASPRGGTTQDAADPWGPLRGDTLAGTASAFAYGATLSLLLGLPEGLAGPEGLWSSLETGVTYGLVLALLIGAMRIRAGRRYLALLLCARARLPWRLGAFLAWSCDAGLLRTSGSTYQFRHRELQEWLARHP
ncbi:NACHT domain-containing protein [Streptomyces melanogenes]|uniref:NACHT domain-containing protein n=1 Tax=Streptomyces melanogenes TaxID=67326 RepID=UPI00167E9F5C|nr:NACHT domain-containing protein [Streptomyces melanogenes]GGP78107.1 hypothetical protein GCM10010278_65620 [Streptomyces melanogenes]